MRAAARVPKSTRLCCAVILELIENVGSAIRRTGCVQQELLVKHRSVGSNHAVMALSTKLEDRRGVEKNTYSTDVGIKRKNKVVSDEVK